MRCERCGQESDECRCVGAEELMGFLREFREANRPTRAKTTAEETRKASSAPTYAWAEAVLAEGGDGPEAGWYPDPTDEFAFRWWNGVAWTARGSHNGLESPE